GRARGATTGLAADNAGRSDARVSASENLPLIADHEIVSAPSASVLAVLRRYTGGRTPAGKAVAVLADPVFDRADPRVKLRAAYAGAARPEMVRSTPEMAPDEPRRRLERAVSDLGDSGSRGTLSRLPFTRQEAEAITSMAPRGESLLAVDFRASSAVAMSGELGAYRIVHFATHGLLDDQHPDLSGLVLSLVDEAGKPQDGFLRLNEIYNLR